MWFVFRVQTTMEQVVQRNRLRVAWGALEQTRKPRRAPGTGNAQGSHAWCNLR